MFKAATKKKRKEKKFYNTFNEIFVCLIAPLSTNDWSKMDDFYFIAVLCLAVLWCCESTGIPTLFCVQWNVCLLHSLALSVCASPAYSLIDASTRERMKRVKKIECGEITKRYAVALYVIICKPFFLHNSICSGGEFDALFGWSPDN